MLTKKHFESHSQALKAMGKREYTEIDRFAEIVASSFLDGGRLYICGIGTSAYLAQYAISLFINGCIMERPPLPAILLHADGADILERQITALGGANDIVLGICVDSGSCELLIKGLRTAVRSGCKTLAIINSDESNISGVCDKVIATKQPDNGAGRLRAQELLMLIMHSLCDKVDNIMFAPAMVDNTDEN